MNVFYNCSSLPAGYIVNKNISDLDTWATVFYVAAFVNTVGLVIFLIYGSAEPLFKDGTRKNQTFDLDLINGEREDSLLLAKKQNVLFAPKFNGINPAFKGDDE